MKCSLEVLTIAVMNVEVGDCQLEHALLADDGINERLALRGLKGESTNTASWFSSVTHHRDPPAIAGREETGERGHAPWRRPALLPSSWAASQTRRSRVHPQHRCGGLFTEQTSSNQPR